eukprot:jgi/Chlat1/5256/Chrsp33S08964
MAHAIMVPVQVKCTVTKIALTEDSELVRSDAAAQVIPITVTMDRLGSVGDIAKQLEARLKGALALHGMHTSSSDFVDTLMLVGPTPIRLRWLGQACDATQDLDYYMPQAQATVFTASVDAVSRMKSTALLSVYVKTIAGHTITFTLPSKLRVCTLMLLIFHKEGTPINHMRLLYYGRQLKETDRLCDLIKASDAAASTWEPCQLHGEMSVHCIWRLRGGSVPSVPFVDVSDATAMQHFPWAKIAPPWCSAARGLCIEGYCRNRSCKAWQNRVIVNLYYSTFDLVLDAGSGRCPACGSVVQPRTCAFNNCEWRYTGVKLDKTNQQPTNPGMDPCGRPL